MSAIDALDALDQLFQNLDRRYQKNYYRTSDAKVEEKPTRDQYGRSLQARVTVDGVPGYQLNTYGADIGKGSQVEVVNIGTPAAAQYRIAAVIPGVAEESPQVIFSEYGGIDLLNLAGIRVRSEGFIILGGDKQESPDGDITWAGGRIEERKYGIEGYNAISELMFGLYTEARAYTVTAGNVINFNPGDFHVGLLGKAHLRVDTALGKLQWLSGNTVLFESYLVDGNPFNHMSGLLRVAASHVGEGIEMGKLPGGPYVIQMLNKEGVPMFLVRVGYDDDPGHYYLRIGRPSPSAHIEMTDVDGEPVINIGGASLTEATLQLANLIGTIGVDNLDIAGLNILYSPAGHTHLLTKAELIRVDGDVAISSYPLRFYNQSGKDRNIIEVFISADTAPTGDAIIVDINNGGTTIFTNQAHRPQIADGQNTGNTTDIDVPTWADGEYLQLDVDNIGSGTVGADLAALVIYTELT